MSLIAEEIRNYIQESLLVEHELGTIGYHDDLLNVLESLQILRMVIDLESDYSITVDNSELTPENLGTINRLAEFIDRKRQESTCSSAAN